MKVLHETKGSLTVLSEHLSTLAALPEVTGILLFTADGNGWSQLDFDAVLKAQTMPIFGAVFPRLIMDSSAYEQGSMCLGLTAPFSLQVLHNISLPGDHILTEIRQFADTVHELSGGTILVLVDGMASRIAALVDGLFEEFGVDSSIIGGGAGSLTLQPTPCLITQDGLLKDAAVLVHIALESKVGVAHGWVPISESFKVTEATNNVIHSLNWRPALEVYQEVVEEHSSSRLDPTAFFETSKAYPFGIVRIDGEFVVRDPIALDEENRLICVGEVPAGSFVRILHGEADALVKSGSLALHGALEGIARSQRRPGELAWVVDCISRALFLEDRIEEELGQIIQGPIRHVFGALTLGEIANNGLDYLQFHNKTCVVAVFSES